MNSYDKGVLLKYNVDEYGNPTSWLITNEQQQVSPIHNLIQLVQIPDENQRLTIWDEFGKKLHETFDVEIVGEDNFRVEYNSGLVHFHPILAGKSVTISYYGRGVEMVSTTRVFHKGEKGVMDVLHDVIEDAKEAMEVVDALGGVAETIEKLDKKIIEGNETVDRIEGLVSELEGYGYTIMLSREAFVVKANEDNEISKNEIASVYSDVVAYKGGKQIQPILTLTDTTDGEFEIIGQRIKLVNMNIDAMKSSVVVNIDCGESLIVKRKLEVTKVSDGKMPYVVEITNGVHGFTSDSKGVVSVEQNVTCDISVSKSDIDYTNYSILVQNKPSGMDYKINANQVILTCRTGSLLPDNGSLLIVVTVDGKAYPKTFTWHKIKQGESSKSLMVTGGQILKYNTHDYSDVPSPNRLTLTATPNGLSGTPKWYAIKDGEYSELIGESSFQLIVLHNNMAIWNNQTQTTIKCELDGYSDEMSIIKLANGQQGQSSYNVVLTNENHSVPIDNSGVVNESDIVNVYTNVLAYYGTELVEPIISKGERIGCDVEIVGNRVNLISLDNSFSNSSATILVEYNGIVIPKVMTISKSKQGNDGSSGENASQYILNVTNGTRSFTYSQINLDPRPSVSSTFIGSLYVNGEEVIEGVSYHWLARGHVGGVSVSNTFTPTINKAFDESVVNNDIVLTVAYNNQTISQVVPIAITKDANGLDWVSEWDDSKVEIKGNKLLAPKIFAGQYDEANDLITGVAIGQDVLNDGVFIDEEGNETRNATGNTIGIVGYQNNKTTFLLDTDGTFMVGNPFEENSSGMYFDGEQYILKANSIAIGGVNVPNQDDVNDLVNGEVGALTGAMESMNEQLQLELEDVNTSITDLSTELNSRIDVTIDDNEKAKIELMCSVLGKEVDDITAKYLSLYTNTSLTDVSLKAELKSCYDDYKVKFDDVLLSKDIIINASTVTQEMIDAFNSKVELFSVSSNALFVVMDKVILAIGQSEVDASLSDMQTSLDKNLKELRDKITSLESGLEEATLDGVFDAIEKAKLESLFIGLEKEVDDIKEEYNAIYTNVNLIDVLIKGKLKTHFDQYVFAFGELKVAFEVIQLATDVIEEDVLEFNRKLATFRTTSVQLTRSLNDAMLNINKTMTDNVVSSAKDQLDKEINDVNNALGNLSNSVESSINGVLNNVEKAKLEAIIETLSKEVGDVSGQYDILYNHAMLTNQIIKNNLKEKHDAYVLTFSELVDALNVILGSTETNVDDINNFNTKLNTFKAKSVELNKAMNEAMISISKSTTDQAVADAKKEIDGEINDVQQSVSDLNDTMNGSFKEGIIGIAEVKAIQERIVALEREFKDLWGQFQGLFESPKLDVDMRQELHTTIINLQGYQEVLIAEINKAIIDYIISQAEINAINKATLNYNNQLLVFKKICNECIENIAKNNSQDIVDALDQEAIFNKLTNNGQVQGLYIQNGKLYINGEYIKADSISANKINLKGLIVTNNSGTKTFEINSDGDIDIAGGFKTFSSTNGSRALTLNDNYIDFHDWDDDNTTYRMLSTYLSGESGRKLMTQYHSSSNSMRISYQEKDTGIIRTYTTYDRYNNEGSSITPHAYVTHNTAQRFRTTTYFGNGKTNVLGASNGALWQDSYLTSGTGVATPLGFRVAGTNGAINNAFYYNMNDATDSSKGGYLVASGGRIHDNGNLPVEKGYWSPFGYGGDNSGVGFDHTTRDGYYTKVGNTVHLSGRIVARNRGNATGHFRIRGLPFRVRQVYSACTFSFFSGIKLSANTQLFGYGEVGYDFINISYGNTESGSGWSHVFTQTNLPGAIDVGFSITYVTD